MPKLILAAAARARRGRALGDAREDPLPGSRPTAASVKSHEVRPDLRALELTMRH